MRFIQPLVFVVAIALLPGCSRQPDADSPLAFAPAATPYVFANLKPLPKPVLESWLALAAPYNQVQGEMLAALRADLGALPPVVQALVPLLEVTQGKLSYAGFEEMGLRPEGLSALYGIGLVPVLRMELGDADKFRKLVADYEHKRGAALPVEKIEKQDYWRLASPEPETPALILAIVEQHLVVTVDIGSKGPSLAELLGLRRPERSVLDSGELAELNDAYDFTPYGTFLLDNRRLAGALSGKDAQTAAALLPSPACQAELAGLAEAVPRTLAGYEQLEAKQLRLNAVVELRKFLDRVYNVTGGQKEDIASLEKSDPIRVLRDNVWGPQIEDAARRDFTVNAMYYDPVTQVVVDYHHGLRDLKKKTLRMIGDEERGNLLVLLKEKIKHASVVDADVAITSDYVYVRGGRLQIGTAQQPYLRRASITLTGNTTADNPATPGFGNKVLALADGVIELHGAPLSRAMAAFPNVFEP